MEDIVNDNDGDDSANFSGCGSNSRRFPNEPLPSMSSMATSTWYIFRFEEDKSHTLSLTSHSVPDTSCVVCHQKCYDHTHPLSRNMPRTKVKTRYSEWKLYNLNALHSVPKSSHLIFWKWKRLKVRVDGWVGVEPPVVDRDEWDDHQQSQLDNLRWNGGWWGKSKAVQRRAIYTYVCLVHLFFSSQPHQCSTSYFKLYPIQKKRVSFLSLFLPSFLFPSSPSSKKRKVEIDFVGIEMSVVVFLFGVPAIAKPDKILKY